MLILSKARVTVRKNGAVRVEGTLARYAPRIEEFVRKLGLKRGVIRYRWGRYLFSKDIDARLHQRLRNFLVNNCPLKG